MRNADNRSASGYVDFISLFKQADLEQALLPHRDSNSYQAVLRYYFACIGSIDSQRLIEPLALLKQTLGQLVDPGRVRRDADSGHSGISGLGQIRNQVEAYETRIKNSIAFNKAVATPVPKNLHFVWLGGGMGAIQRDYINLWKQVLNGQGYQLNLWYDSDALLAWQTNKSIVEAAKADAMLHGGVSSTSESELGALYEERAIVLKQQMFMHINAAVDNGRSADEARVDLLTRAYGQDAAKLEQQIEQNHLSLLELAGGDLRLRDLHGASEPLTLQAVYDRETRLRGNLAAASDVVRVEVLFDESGIYADVDNLPPLAKTLGGVDISEFGGDARLGVLQLLLDHNPQWMPGRQALRGQYTDYFEQIPQEHRVALETFAKSQPALGQVFQAPAERLVRPQALRAVAEQNSLSNAYLMAHAGSAMLKAVIERYRFNYQVINDTARLAAKRGVALHDFDAMSVLSREVLEKQTGPFAELSMEEDVAASYLAGAVAGYFGDGIRPQSEWTIYLTGPGAMRDGLADYERQHFIPRDVEALRMDAAITPLWTVNRKTEEEQDHSWKDNETDQQQWVSNEQQRWQKGDFATRYSGDIAALLKQSTVLFEEGWPVIEGRPVLLTEILQAMIDRLGEPFVAAMRQGHNGPLDFADAPPLGFDERQAIKAQPSRLQAPASLGDTSIEDLPLDELLSRLADGSLHVFQISALHRVLLGQLLGAHSLDNQSFTQLAPELDNLANSVNELGASGRYAVIERHLYQRRAPAFMAGLASHIDELVSSSESALTLKKAALGQAHTLFEWGRHVALIQQVATLEHRQQVIERVGQVLDQFEASSVKLVPQDLLLHGLGDTAGGRCYPLALVMSAALERGALASNRLRERFNLATIDPQQQDSAVFLDALEELRGVQLQEVGTPLGRMSVEQVTATLQGYDSTRTMMLNSDNHAMLVAKTVIGGRTTFHFYDPNFGVFEFEKPAMFQRSLAHFFQKQGMARHYAAYGSDTHPTFDLIELHGERVAGWSLSNGLKVEQLLESDTLMSGIPERALRVRLNSARGQSLVSNTHLGRSLLELDSLWWGQQIAHVTDGLQGVHTSVSPLVPLFETLEITPKGEYRISMIDPLQPEHIVQVISGDHRLLRIKNYLSEQFAKLAGKSTVGPFEVGSVHTLNTGFTIQALMNALRGREGEDRTLTIAVRLHAYVNYAQLVHGNALDVAGLVSLVRIGLGEEKIIARTCAPVVREALGHIANEGVGAILGLANVGFDIYQLATAQDEVEQAQFGTQLAFDSASLALTAGGLGAAVAGATTAAAVLGGAGVILGGLAIGVAALAQGFARIAEEAQAVGLFFDDLERSYRGVGYRYDKSLRGWVPHSSLIVQSLDFKQGRMTLDSPKLYRLHDHFGVPDFNPDYQQAINIQRELSLPGGMKFEPPAGQQVVLPCTPQTCYGYEYKALPFATLRHDSGFDTARRLEKKDRQGQWQFLFSFYSFPVHYILHRLVPVYRATVIEVQLDAVERLLAVPVVPQDWHDKVSYRIEGAGASCTLMMNRGVSVELLSPSLQQCRWNLVATWASERDVVVDVGGQIVIGNVKVQVSGRGHHDVLITLADQRLFRVDYARRQLNVLEQTASAEENEQSLLEHYKSLAQEHRLVLPYTPVHRFLIPFEAQQQPRYTTAWYEAAEDRFLYIRNEEVQQADETLLALVVGDSAYFYEPQNFIIWQVDAASGLLKCRYRLLLMRGQCSVRRIEVDAQGVIHIEQQWTGEDLAVTQFNYFIHDGQLMLGSVTHGMARELGERLFSKPALADWSAVLGNYLTLSPVPEQAGVSTVDWLPAPYVSVCWMFASDKRDLAWVRSRDGLCIHPFASPGRTRGWADSIKNLGDLVLLPVDDENDLFFIYDRFAQRLCRLQRAMVSAERWPAQWGHQWVQPVGLKDVVTVEGGYLALTEDGMFFNLTAQGEVRLGGLSERWLKDRPQWWLTLESIATQYSADSFAVLGLRNAQGDGSLAAWFVDNRLLLCDPGHDKVLRLLGVTPNRQAAWLFDLSNGEICNQVFFDSQQLAGAFGAGVHLLSQDVLPAVEVEWDDRIFASVTGLGAELRGTTVDGVVLDLRYQETERVVGVNLQWVTAHSDDLTEHLRALSDTGEHDAFISVASGTNHLQWYDVANARMIRVAGGGLPSDCELLGTRQTDVLLYEPQGKLVYVYPRLQAIGPFEYVRRNADVLVVEGQKRVDDLLPLIADDVTRLVLRLGDGGVTYHLSKATWLRLDSVIVDCRHGLGEVPVVPGKLIWALDAPEKLQLSIVEGHLIIVDPDLQHSLILRDVCSSDPALRGNVFLGFEGGRSYSVSSLVRALSVFQDATAGASLEQLLTAVPA
ncbi:TcdA/TcdB pore-forming domain-containing protein [Pseudomonas sp. NPDC087346]|uniref:TcdA/TcdB pore-forming domain-containing protein n=1 Tax=Pseudomonas sp. NPDC087346 TaxID=3364438 RepID=UPI00381E3B43